MKVTVKVPEGDIQNVVIVNSEGYLLNEKTSNKTFVFENILSNDFLKIEVDGNVLADRTIGATPWSAGFVTISHDDAAPVPAPAPMPEPDVEIDDSPVVGTTPKPFNLNPFKKHEN